MNIAVISDIHNRIDHLALVMDEIQAAACVRIFCLGDVESSFTLNALIEMTPTIPINMVYGNNDFDISEFEQISLRHPRLILHGMSADISMGGSRIGLVHSPEIAGSMARSGEYDFVFFGHTHEASREQVGQCLLANPGEIMGRKGKIGYGIFDSDAKTFSLHTLRI